MYCQKNKTSNKDFGGSLVCVCVPFVPSVRVCVCKGFCFDREIKQPSPSSTISIVAK